MSFPPSLPFDAPTPQQFALQLWDVPQKRANVSLVVGVIGLLARHAGVSLVLCLPPCIGHMLIFYHVPQPPDGLSMACARCLVELAIASNAPTTIKTQVREP